MNLLDVLALVGAVAIFLFGMELLCAGLHALSQQRIQSVLTRATRSVWCATVLSAVVTAFVQSSSAVTVIIVGLVAGGALTLEQSAGLIAGANIGTCTTAFLVCIGLRSSWMTVFHSVWPMIVLSVLLPLLLSRRCPAALSIVGGLIALMAGMARMQDALSPLSNSSLFAHLLWECSSPLTGMLAGTLITAVLQSSSACIALLQTISASGMLSLGCVVPIILGQNIGTCITAMIAALRTSCAARQTALLHLLFNVIGAIVILPPLQLINVFYPQLLAIPADSATIALVHLICNIAAAVVFLPLRHTIIACITQNSPPGKQKAVVK